MSDRVKKRAYSSPIREEQAAQTRARIVEAADELFRETSYARTTIKQIAEAAGVAPDTIYAAFGTKARVLTGIIDARLAGGSKVSNVMERPEALRIRDEPDPRKQIEMFAKDMAGLLERTGPIFEVMRSAASVDEELAPIYREMEGYRLRNMRTLAGWLEANGGLNRGPEEAAELIWTLVSPDVHRLLRGIRGWSRTRYARWLSDSLQRLLA